MNNSELYIAFKNQLDALVLENSCFKIALSGGLDSVVLLHLFSRLEKIEVSAHHIHHGLSENADNWALFCQKTANQLKINCAVTRVVLDKKNRISLEALARDERYQALKSDLTENSYLVTAHHQDDQLETVLLALKRGAGLAGLQGIVSKQALEKGYLIRPLLNFSREQLEAYAQEFDLEWKDDESNDDQRFDRNFIRHTISPLLKARWPSITKTVARSAAHCNSQQQLIEEITETDLQLCLDNKSTLKIDLLKKLSETRKNNVLRGWFKKAHLNYPSSKQLIALWENIALAQADAEPQLLLQGHMICRYQGLLYLVDKNKSVTENRKIVWCGEDQLILCSGQLTLRFNVQREFLNELHRVEICFRHQLPADFKCQPIGRDKSRSIKKLLHEYHVAPWLRDHVAFVFIDDMLVEAVGLWRCENAFSNLFYVSIG